MKNKQQKKISLKTLSTTWQLDKIFNKYTWTNSNQGGYQRVERAFNYEYWVNEYQNAVKELVTGVKGFKSVKDIKNFVIALEKFEEQFASGGPGFYYIWLKFQLESNNEQIEQLYQKYAYIVNNVSTSLQKLIIKLSKVPVELQKKVLTGKFLKDYKFWLHYVFLDGKYTLPIKTEQILSKLSQPLQGNWADLTAKALAKTKIRINVKKAGGQKLLEELLNKEIKDNVKFITLPFTALRSFLTLPAKYAQHITYVDALHGKKLKDFSYMATQELNSLLQAKYILAKERGFKNTLQVRAFGDQIKEQTINTLATTVSDNFDISAIYYSKLKQKTGINLHYGLRSIRPNIKGGNPKITYEIATKFISNVLQKIDTTAYEFFNKMVNGHIDVYSKAGKSGGAFSMSINKKLPQFILLNWQNNLNSLTTLAHEFGHAFHSYLSFKHQNALNTGYSLAVAEFASTFMETLILQKFLAEVQTNGKFRRHINITKRDLPNFIQYVNWVTAHDMVATVFRQMALFNFELELHSLIEKQFFVPESNINELFVKHMTRYLGPSVQFNKYHKYGWVSWSHIRRPFYVYTYVSGYLSALALNNKIKDYADNKHIKLVFKVYKLILQQGGSNWVEEIFKNVGLDIAKSSFWQRGLGLIKKHITGLE